VRQPPSFPSNRLQKIAHFMFGGRFVSARFEDGLCKTFCRRMRILERFLYEAAKNFELMKKKFKIKFFKFKT
jgi:hypothetical protein